MLHMQAGKGASDYDHLYEEMKLQASREFDQFIRDKNTRFDAKALIIDAYEGVLYDKRRGELEVLN